MSDLATNVNHFIVTNLSFPSIAKLESDSFDDGSGLAVVGIWMSHSQMLRHYLCYFLVVWFLGGEAFKTFCGLWYHDDDEV
ncbi:hypothetical protein TSUD_174850 [Trifolium subterraneum]|uniref:Uncharacterized protein n=1 Tax=Trifolium subterraneum TaxID=3900 RepID=A0A2Z6PQ23_TRISU|nr:hypothetical protein TSUD_174850 [Trifolium subterraneum]